jgi:two-component system response regulator HydG
MPVTMQPKLLRVLESGDVIRLGSNDLRKVDVRFVSATNRDLRESIAGGRFREDLFFRLKGVEIRLPSLRERREDIPLLVNHGIGKYTKELGRAPMPVSQAAMMRLTAYDWPGNVRELMMVVHRMVVTAMGDVIDVADVPEEIRSADRDEGGAAGPDGSLAGIDMAQLEKEAIRQTLARTQGNREQAAQLLGIGERTLYRKIKDYGLR